MKKKLILLSALGLLASTSVAFAHPNGLYRIGAIHTDGTFDTLTFLIEKPACPTSSVKGALRGSLRLLTFKVEEKLTEHFITGNYVETHRGTDEYYVQTDKNCVPLIPRNEYRATHDSFDGEELVFISR
jgi:hypothetical protein